MSGIIGWWCLDSVEGCVLGFEGHFFFVVVGVSLGDLEAVQMAQKSAVASFKLEKSSDIDGISREAAISKP